MRAQKLIAFVLGISLVAGACGSSEVSPTSTSSTTIPSSTTPSTPPTTTPGSVPTGDEVRADVGRVTDTGVGIEEIQALVESDHQLAFDLLASIEDEGNVLLSPYSIATALTMTYAGAAGETRAEMADVLHVSLEDRRLHRVRNALDLGITTVPPAAEDEPPPFTISTANSIWGQAGYPFLDPFLETMALEYGAGLRLVDFSEPEPARRSINDWVETQTAGRIVDLIPEGIIDVLTTLVLVNAIWFKANWLFPFTADATVPADFTTDDGRRVVVDMMHGGGQLRFFEGAGYAAVELPYAGEASMLLVVPDSGRFDEVAGGLGSELLGSVDAGLSEHVVDLAMPRFEFRSSFQLKSLLAALGMPTAFVPPHPDGSGADFTGIAPQRELYIQDVVHQAFIAVDEKGTEAAAATAVVMGRTSAPPPAELTIDRPFFFLIRHAGSGEILFLGRVVNPSGG